MTKDNEKVKISCRDLWKVFGEDPRGFLARHGGAPESGAFAEEEPPAPRREAGDPLTDPFADPLG